MRFRAIGGVLVVLIGGAALADATVETTDARVVRGRLVSISAERVVVAGDRGKQTIGLAEVVEINLAEPADPMSMPGQNVVTTVQGDVLAINEMGFDGNSLHVETSLLGKADLPVGLVRSIYLPSAPQTPLDLKERWEAMKLPPAAGDRLLVTRRDKEPLAVEGVLEAIGPEKITLRRGDSSGTIGRSVVRIIHLAAVSSDTAKPVGVLVDRDGSTLTFTALTLEGDSMRVTSSVAGEQTVALAKVAAIRFASDNIVLLADIKPDTVREYGFFDTTFHYRVNSSAGGKPLRLGGRTFRSGLGMHSFCELTYKLGGEYSAMVATAGIDDGVRPQGDATLTLLGDGKPLTKPIRLTGKDDPQPVRIKLQGVKTLVIRVDFGADELGFSDHVDLAGARLIK